MSKSPYMSIHKSALWPTVQINLQHSMQMDTQWLGVQLLVDMMGAIWGLLQLYILLYPRRDGNTSRYIFGLIDRDAQSEWSSRERIGGGRACAEERREKLRGGAACLRSHLRHGDNGGRMTYRRRGWRAWLTASHPNGGQTSLPTLILQAQVCVSITDADQCRYSRQRRRKTVAHLYCDQPTRRYFFF